MKSFFSIFLLTVLLLSCSTRSGENEGTYEPGAKYIQIVLFHLTHRCESCNAVEQVTKELLEEEYWDAYSTGRVKFVSLDFQSENGKKAAELLKASGQTLYVVKGDRIDNLTSPAFMYASTHPDYFREALRKELDQYLK